MKDEKLFEVKLSKNWGNNSGKIVKWNRKTLFFCLNKETYPQEWIEEHKETIQP